jgi:hypothetical protein
VLPIEHEGNTADFCTFIESCNGKLTDAWMIASDPGLDWAAYGANLADALLALFVKTGRKVTDDATRHTYVELDLLAALRFVLPEGVPTS